MAERKTKVGGHTEQELGIDGRTENKSGWSHRSIRTHAAVKKINVLRLQGRLVGHALQLAEMLFFLADGLLRQR